MPVCEGEVFVSGLEECNVEICEEVNGGRLNIPVDEDSVESVYVPSGHIQEPSSEKEGSGQSVHSGEPVGDITNTDRVKKQYNF